MAQNVTLLGASYADVPAVQLPKTGGGTALFADPSVTTAVAADVAQGKYFLLADGSIGTGTASGGGGGSSYTLLTSKEFTVSTTSTSASSVGTVTASQAWTSGKILYVKIRDKAGKRKGYCLGSDNFLVNVGPVNNNSTTQTSFVKYCIRYTATGLFGISASSSTTAYGVYAYSIDSSGQIAIYTRYSSSSSLTINGTFLVEVYLLDWPGNVSPLS